MSSEQNTQTLDKHTATIIGENLRRIRRAKGYSQRDIGGVLGVSFQQVQKYEKGENRLPVEKLYTLHRHYSLPLTQFFQGVEPDAPVSAEYDRIEHIAERLSQMDDAAMRDKICAVNMILLEGVAADHHA